MEAKIQKAKELAAAIALVDGIERCHADDWNQFGEFSLVATIPTTGHDHKPPKGYDLRKVIPKLRKVLKGIPSSIFSPKRIYDQYRDACFFKGYESNRIMIDITL